MKRIELTGTVLPIELEEYQAERIIDGIAASTVGINTGMRPGELRLLRWEYVDHKAGFIRLPAAFTKAWREWTATTSSRQRRPSARPWPDTPDGWTSSLKMLTKPLTKGLFSNA